MAYHRNLRNAAARLRRPGLCGVLALAGALSPGCASFEIVFLGRDPAVVAAEQREAARQEMEEEFASREWELEDFPVEPVYTDREMQIPVLLAGLPEDAPAAFLLPDLPSAREQGRQASGAAWAAGYLGVSYQQRKQANKPGYLCSPAFIYNRLNNGKNQGVPISEALELARIAGCAAWRFMPYDEDDIRTQPDLDAMQNATRHRIRGYARVDFKDPDQIRAHLLEARPVIVNLRITHNFTQLDAAVWEKPRGERVGLQPAAIVGYDHAAGTFLIQNSFGEDWGRLGRASIPYEWFVRLNRQAYVLW